MRERQRAVLKAAAARQGAIYVSPTQHHISLRHASLRSRPHFARIFRRDNTAANWSTDTRCPFFRIFKRSVLGRWRRRRRIRDARCGYRRPRVSGRFYLPCACLLLSRDCVCVWVCYCLRAICNDTEFCLQRYELRAYQICVRVCTYTSCGTSMYNIKMRGCTHVRLRPRCIRPALSATASAATSSLFLQEAVRACVCVVTSPSHSLAPSLCIPCANVNCVAWAVIVCLCAHTLASVYMRRVARRR